MKFLLVISMLSAATAMSSLPSIHQLSQMAERRLDANVSADDGSSYSYSYSYGYSDDDDDNRLSNATSSVSSANKAAEAVSVLMGVLTFGTALAGLA